MVRETSKRAFSGESGPVHTWDGLRCHVAWRQADGPHLVQCKSLSLQGSGNRATLPTPGHPRQCSVHPARHQEVLCLLNTLLYPRTLAQEASIHFPWLVLLPTLFTHLGQSP